MSLTLDNHRPTQATRKQVSEAGTDLTSRARAGFRSVCIRMSAAPQARSELSLPGHDLAIQGSRLSVSCCVCCVWTRPGGDRPWPLAKQVRRLFWPQSLEPAATMLGLLATLSWLPWLARPGWLSPLDCRLAGHPAGPFSSCRARNGASAGRVEGGSMRLLLRATSPSPRLPRHRPAAVTWLLTGEQRGRRPVRHGLPRYLHGPSRTNDGYAHPR